MWRRLCHPLLHDSISDRIERLIAVTGAGGYLGGRIVRRLVAEGEFVRAIVRRPLPWLDQLGVEQVVGDGSELEGARAVIHLAAPNEVTAAAKPGSTTAEAITTAALVAAAAVEVGLERVVLASTVHVYGARIVDGARLTEDLRCEPRHPYAVARLAAEHLMATMLDGSDTDLVVLRITNGVGAPADPSVDRWTLLVNDLARSAATDGRIELRSPGLQWRDFIPVCDVCSVVTAVCTSSAVPAGTYNLGSGRSRTVREVADLVADAVFERLGTRPAITGPSATGPAPGPYVVDVSRLRACGLLASPTALEEAVGETVDACLAAAGPR